MRLSQSNFTLNMNVLCFHILSENFFLMYKNKYNLKLFIGLIITIRFLLRDELLEGIFHY